MSRMLCENPIGETETMGKIKSRNYKLTTLTIDQARRNHNTIKKARVRK